MTEPELITWFKELLDRAAQVQRDQDGYYNEQQASAWLSEAESALAAVFPPGHPIMGQWRAIYKNLAAQKVFIVSSMALEPALGVFKAAFRILTDGRLQSLLDGIRAETVAELIEQADALHFAGHHVAAAVIAGGALETHLLHLCQRSGLVPKGEGSISKYDDAIAQARNQGTVTIYGAADSKLIKWCGNLRNDGAHTPAAFTHSGDIIKQMIVGIGDFVSRVP